ncbi:hypothetical protein [Azospirillum agricola]|uniref:hypothetical protein n=1 Tax=Azospirillum agricola TaxID=1720247 RepID=UPI000A0F3ABA|nr:hypothetical protein [Azospirillum agricola]MBP2228096.1 hypothetical protein [Azospirillum agricola]SMH54087.1 hypothetical protein SAMN02982994_3464 [Azospirillum lipoferum]
MPSAHPSKSPPPPVEVSREETAGGAVFVATPATSPRIRTRYLLIAGLLATGFIAGAGLAPDYIANMLQWLAVFCAAPVLLLWVVMLTEAVRRRAVRLGVTRVGLTVDGGRIYPHETIRDLTLYPLVGGRPLFVAWIEPGREHGHKAELALVTGGVAPNDAVKEALRAAGGRGVRLVMHRRDGRPAIVLVRGLTLSSGETLLAALAAELRAHSR